MHWRQIQRGNFRHWAKLADFLELDREKRRRIVKNPFFPLNLPRRLADKIEKNSLVDPILLQFFPLDLEKRHKRGFLLDPVCDRSFRASPHLLHKYSGRVLLLTTGACAMHCRFCFRQNYRYEKGQAVFERELEYIASQPSIYEVILSGGDPLSLRDETLASLIGALERIPHLKLLRFHTRFPLGIPERITDRFLAILAETRLQLFFSLHVNHPKEVDEEVVFALQKLRKLCVPLLSQTVLLKGVNDDVAVLEALLLRLIQAGVLPYYLHHLDPVVGSGHFAVPLSRGRALIAALRARLPGYGVPKYVREKPFEKSKSAL